MTKAKIIGNTEFYLRLDEKLQTLFVNFFDTDKDGEIRKEVSYRFLTELREHLDEKIKMNEDLIEEILKLFFPLYKNYPTKDEIHNHLKGQLQFWYSDAELKLIKKHILRLNDEKLLSDFFISVNHTKLWKKQIESFDLNKVN